MGITFDGNLAPEVYPLAWLVGAWRGEGTIGYGPIEPARVALTVEFRAADGPYLAYRARTWLLADGANADAASAGAPSEPPRRLWQEEAGFWRVTPNQASAQPPFEIEVLISDAAGYQSLYLGEVDGPRIRLATDAMVRTATAPAINAATRLYGHVNGDLLWAWDIAGFGHELGSYLAAQLARSDGDKDL
ncbi:MAG: FABP family protein [Bifidobacteriaceae bacterium]|nr:FABP family protein [Bifidobacteriaceae bacterium]